MKAVQFLSRKQGK